ncbi:MAG: D-alanyl-D-alanine carboxypeptidase [Ferroplasma sp.]
MELLSYCFLNEKGEKIKAYNEDLNMVPASNMKLVSGYTAYKLLKKDFKFETKFSIDRDILTISGDPTFLLDCNSLKNTLSLLNIKTGIKYVETADIFDEEIYRGSWEIEDKKYCYGSPILPYTVNEGCICEKGFPAGAHSKYAVPGKKDSDLIEKVFKNLPDSYGNALNEAYYKSSLVDVLKHIMHYSCNYNIEVLFKYLSYSRYGIGTWNKSIELEKDFIGNLFGKERIYIDDGSGLSTKNLLTTSFLSELLYYINKNDKEFFNLMPAPGSGTLNGRLDELKDYNIRAKTGTVFGCSFISGIVLNKGVYFSIGINNSVNGEKSREDFIDGLLIKFLKSL